MPGIGAGLAQHRLLLAAARLGEGTARVEAAARRRREGARHVARQQHAHLAHAGIGPRDRRQQRLRIGMQRPRVEVALGGDLDQLAEIHHRHAVADVLHHGEVVGDEQIGEAEAALQVLQQVDDLRLDRDIEGGDRLVAHDQVGIDGERAGDADPLALAARELVRIAPRLLGQQADDIEKLAHAALALGLGVQPVHRHRLGQNLADRHAGVQGGIRVLEDDLHVAAQPAQGVLVEVGDLLALEAYRACRRVHQAQHKPAGQSTCRSPICPPAPGSRRAISKLTPRPRARCHALRRISPRVTGKCFHQAVNLRTGGCPRSCRDPRQLDGRLPAGDEMAGAELAQRRRLRVAAPVGKGSAARSGSPWAGCWAGHRALDGGQPLAVDIEPRNRA
jgi:hypothetical protein